VKLAELIVRTKEHGATVDTLCFLMNATRTQIYLLGEIPDSVVKAALKIIAKHKKGTPIAYLLGMAFFDGKEFIVNENVLVPRSDTEFLLEHAEKQFINDVTLRRIAEYKILDLCTGSGILAVCLGYLAKFLKNNNRIENAVITAADISKEALKIAAKNAALHCQNINFMKTDLFAGTDKYDLIVCNPPYVKTGDIGKEDKYILKEPKIALDGGAGGLTYYNRIINEAGGHLLPNGTLMLEIGAEQGGDVIRIAQKAGFGYIKVHKDLSKHDRVVIIRK
jgi:release factor glutamine methyltransferase